MKMTRDMAQFMNDKIWMTQDTTGKKYEWHKIWMIQDLNKLLQNRGRIKTHQVVIYEMKLKL